MNNQINLKNTIIFTFICLVWLSVVLNTSYSDVIRFGVSIFISILCLIQIEFYIYLYICYYKNKISSIYEFMNENPLYAGLHFMILNFIIIPGFVFSVAFSTLSLSVLNVYGITILLTTIDITLVNYISKKCE